MRPIYRALQKLTPPQHTATSSPGIHTLVSVIASYEWSAIFGWISWQPIKQPLSALRFLKLIAYPSLWLWGVIRRQHFCNSWCENTEKKENSGISSDALCVFADQRRHLQRWTHTITVSLLPFHLEGLAVWLLTYSLRSGGSSTVTMTDCVLTFIGRLMLTHWWPRSQVEKMTCFLFTSHVSPEWPSCVSRRRAASM